MPSEIFTFMINSTVLRIGSILLAVFIIQILVTFARYNFRLAEHLSSVANALELSEGDANKFGLYVEALTANAPHIGRMPRSPFEKVLETIKELVSKIPSKTLL